MIQTLVATLMWALVASLLIFRRKRADRSITHAATTIAIAMTLNVDGIYTAVDPLVGGTNLATLLADALLMTGLFFLGRGVLKTGEYRPRLVRATVSAPVLLVALLAITAAFLFIDRDTTTTRFMSDLGAQPAAAVYSIINFSYGALVIATMLVLAARQYRHSTGIQRLPAALLSLGSTFGVALCLAVIVLDIATPPATSTSCTPSSLPTIRCRSSLLCSSAPGSRSNPPSAAPSTTPDGDTPSPSRRSWSRSGTGPRSHGPA